MREFQELEAMMAELVDWLNLATGGQISDWKLLESGTVDPLKREVRVSLHEPFAKDEMKLVRTIARELGRPHNYYVVGVKGGDSLRLDLMRMTPGRDQIPGRNKGSSQV